MTRPRLVVGLAALVAAVVALSALGDPPFWDALGCYVPLARFIAAHGLDLAAYHTLPMFRPPLLLLLFAAAIRAGRGHLALHAIVLAFAALLPIATWRMARRLGASTQASAAATAFCLLSPIFLAQLGIEQSDLPAAALCALAWLCALDERRALFVVVTSLAMLTKESAHVVCLPAAYLWAERPGRVHRLARAWPALAPYAVLLAWLVAQRALIGHLLFQGQAALLGPQSLPSSVIHSFIEGGRLLLTLLAIPVVRSALRDRDQPASRAIVATFAVVVALPFAFPAGLPRYMLPSLPMHCALAALGLQRFSASRRSLLTAGVLVALLALSFAPTLDSRAAWHLESNLRYRWLLAAERAATTKVASLSPRAVVAPFPFDLTLGGDPADGFVDRPIAVVSPGAPLDALCRGDLLVSDGDEPARRAEALLSSAHALTPVDEWHPFGQRLQLFRIDCPHDRSSR